PPGLPRNPGRPGGLPPRDTGQRRSSMTTTAQNGRPQAKPRTLEEHIAWAMKLAADGGDLRPVVHALLTEKFEMLAALEQVREHQEVLRAEMEALCAPEHYPVIVTALHLEGKPSVEVAGNGGRLRVAVHPDVPLDRIQVGSRGLLSQKRNCLLEVF